MERRGETFMRAGYWISAFVLILNIVQRGIFFSLDLQVFQDAGRAFLQHAPLYMASGFYSRSGFAFIYPPFAALVFAPGAYLSQLPAQLLWQIFGIDVPLWFLLYAVFTAFKSQYPHLGLKYTPTQYTWAFLGIAALTAQITDTSNFGQVDVILAALVVVDLFLMPKRWSGLLIGLAAGIKITPIAFLFPLLLFKRWRAVVNAIFSLGVTVVVGWLLRPAESKEFWLQVAFDTNRAGGKAYIYNQAISGPVARFVPEQIQQPVWLVLVAVFLLLALIGCWRYTKQQNFVMVTLLWLMAVLLCQPYAVYHHWSIAVAALPLFFLFWHEFAGATALRWLAVIALGIVYDPFLREIAVQLSVPSDGGDLALLFDVTCFAGMIVLCLLVYLSAPRWAGSSAAAQH